VERGVGVAKLEIHDLHTVERHGHVEKKMET